MHDTSSIRTGFRPHNQTNLSRPQKLSFLRPQNFLPPSHPNQVPVTAHQLQELFKWSGSNVTQMSQYLNCSLQSLRMWSKTSRSLQDTKLMPPTVWHYMCIVLGLKQQPQIRRVEPSPFISNTYNPTSKQPLTFRAVITYHLGTISIYNDSPLNESKEPLAVIPVEFEADTENQLLTISGMSRSDICPWQFENNDGEQTTASLNDFIEKFIWPTCWRLHDFYSLQPTMFLEKEHLLPMHDKDFKLPDATTLYRFCRWLGASAADVAALIWEQSDYMRFLVSPAATNELLTAKETYKILESDSEEDKKFKKRQIFNKKMKTTISAQGWNILTAATGLSPTIKVIGQADPRVRNEKLIKTKEVNGVPIEYVKIRTVVDWVDLAKTEIAITYSISTQLKKGKERTVTFKLEDNRGNFELENKMSDEEAPKAWSEAFTVDPSLEVPPESLVNIQNWFDKALWRYNWIFIYNQKMK